MGKKRPEKLACVPPGNTAFSEVSRVRGPRENDFTGGKGDKGRGEMVPMHGAIEGSADEMKSNVRRNSSILKRLRNVERAAILEREKQSSTNEEK